MHLPPTFTEEHQLNVVIETPKFSNFKADFDPKLHMFRLSKTLPAGMHFPFDFGFIPGTLGDDGDPLDVIVLSPYPLFVGCVATANLIGVLEARQTAKDSKKAIRNDRLIVSLHASCDGADSMFSNVSELPSMLRDHIEAFFVQYNRLSDKKFEPEGWHGPKRAKALLNIGIEQAKQK